MLPDLDQLDAWIAADEAATGGIRPNCEKQIVWADGMAKTQLSIVYIHGFSATAGEVRPLPDMIAKALGANLYFTRLEGHGQDGEAMGKPRLPDWERDMVQALEVGAALGDGVILMGCSTGCTLITTALAQGAMAKGVVFVSPNYGLRHRIAQFLLELPMVRKWGPLLVGRTQNIETISPANSALWTLQYDTQAVFTMADAVRTSLASPIEAIKTPAYFAYCDVDKVVNPSRTKRVMARWGGAIREDVLVRGETDDKMGHVMAGDVFSPAQTAPLADRIIDWAKQL